MDLSVLKKLRKMNKVTLKQMSADIGISSDRLSLIERGKVNPSFDSVVSIVRYLGCELVIGIS